MAKESKIEKYGCQEIVASGQRLGKSYREIAKECSEWAGEAISHTAVQRYIESIPGKKKEVVVESKQAIVNMVHQEFNIIQMNLHMTNRLMQRFEIVDNLPAFFDERMDELVNRLVTNGEKGNVIEYLERWQREFGQELHRKVYEIATLNKEMRENMKFLVQLREKAFEFDLMQEYLSLFMSIFRDANADAFDIAMRGIQSNPRMMKIVEQQQFRMGKEDQNVLEAAKEQADRNSVSDEGGDRRAALLGDLRTGIEEVRAANRPRAH